MAVKNAIYKVDNGSGFDEINFKTVASQVKMASGVNLESGFASNKADAGYSKSPNGTIEQWASVYIGTGQGGNFTTGINFPIGFPNKALAVTAILRGSQDEVRNAACVGIIGKSATSFDLALYREQAHLGFTIEWRAIGY